MLAEVKELEPARYGFKAVAKHVPDQAFLIEPVLYRRLEQRFERELMLWGSSPSIHLIAAATFGINSAGLPQLEEVTLMPTSSQWIPIDDALDLQLLERLVHEHRAFAKACATTHPSRLLPRNPARCRAARAGAVDRQSRDATGTAGTRLALAGPQRSDAGLTYVCSASRAMARRTRPPGPTACGQGSTCDRWSCRHCHGATGRESDQSPRRAV